MICEGILQYRVRQNLSKVFNQRLTILDWDTHNTARGRPDAVFLTDTGQLMVVEFELELAVDNIYNSLIVQAFKGAEKWYLGANQADIQSRYEYTFRHCYPNKETPPDIRQVLGLGPGTANLWDRRKKCIVIAAAPQVGAGVEEAARSTVKAFLDSTGSPMPFEAYVYRITGDMSDKDIVVSGSEVESVGQSDELETAPPEGPGLPRPHQHRKGQLTGVYEQVKNLLPKYMSNELENEAGYYLYNKADFQKVLKLMAWHEYDVDVCFEFSTMDLYNDIKGPHCQLHIEKLCSLGSRVQKELSAHLKAITDQLECAVADLECKGTSWPLKQYKIARQDPCSSMSPDAIARALGRFCSVVYPIVNPIIRSALE